MKRCLLIGFLVVWLGVALPASRGVVGADFGVSAQTNDGCPRATEWTAPEVGPWFRIVHGPTYEHLEVHFRLADQYGDPESPLYLYRAADGVWRTTVDLTYQDTPCLDQYVQLIDFSLGVLNEGVRPFTWDNQADVADYETFLMGVHGWEVFLPVVGGGG